VKELSLSVKGWVSPLTIEYAYAIFEDGKNTLFWRIKGTAHTFIIDASQFNIMSKGNAESHFINFLTQFRNELDEWADEENQTEWMRSYLYMYRNFITF
jgi:hypothetical protein